MDDAGGRDALIAAEAPPRMKPTNYPPPFAAQVSGRVKRPLGDAFGLTNFGVNLTRLPPGAKSALHHRHARQDELVYVLEGTPTLVVEGRETALAPGMVAGFAAGTVAHHLENRSDADCVIIEVGDRSEGDAVDYPNDDLMITTGPNQQRIAAHKDGTPY